jgi:hypothetical protein
MEEEEITAEVVEENSKNDIDKPEKNAGYLTGTLFIYHTFVST